MKDIELLRELSRRSGLPETAVVLVVQELRELIHEGAIDPASLPELAAAVRHAIAGVSDPCNPDLVDALIARAKRHPLGIEFLLDGGLATVAIALDAHAFTVEAARVRLLQEMEIPIA